MTPPTRFRFFGWYVKWNHFQNNHEKSWENRPLIPFIQPFRFRYLIGGVMTPPYETNR